MIFKEVFDNKIFPEMKKEVEEKSIYNPTVTKAMPQQSKVFPIVPTKLLPIERQYNNLSYGEETNTFGIEINVYAMAKGNVSKRTICDEVTKCIIKYFEDNYHVKIKVDYDAINADSNVHRNIIKITGKLDTKYGLDNLVIYPN